MVLASGDIISENFILASGDIISENFILASGDIISEKQKENDHRKSQGLQI